MIQKSVINTRGEELSIGDNVRYQNTAVGEAKITSFEVSPTGEINAITTKGSVRIDSISNVFMKNNLK